MSQEPYAVSEDDERHLGQLVFFLQVYGIGTQIKDLPAMPQPS